jgi:predicted permease
MAVCMTLDLFLLMPLTMVLVSTAEGGRTDWRRALLSAVGGLFSNPRVVGIVLGVAVSAVGLPLPATVRTFTALLGGAAGPCALFTIGATLAGQPRNPRVREAPALPEGSLPEVGLMSVFKLVVHPLAMWGVLAGVFSVDPLWVAAAVLAASLPVASTVYVVAGRYGTYLPQVSSAILVSTAASVVTVSIVLTLLFGTG